MRKVFLSVCVAFVLMTMAPAVSADDLVGASGECYSDDSYEEGGNAYIAVTSDGEVDHDGIVGDNPADPGILRAATTFAQGQIAVVMGDQEEACEAPTDDEDREGEDYLEVHAGPVQVCYNGDPHVTVDDNECDTRPHGPPDQ